MPIGFQSPFSTNGQTNALQFLVRQILTEVHTATIVEVQASTNAGADEAVGFVDVKVLVNLLDGEGKAHPHDTIHHLPYYRLQGGANAVILDPQKGDLGIALFAERDISSVKTNKAQSNPGTRRKFDWADGMYIGGLLNGVPTQYVRFSSSGVDVVSPSAINLTAPNIQINGVTDINGAFTQGGGSNGGDATIAGTMTADTDVVVAGKSVVNHDHVGDSGGTTGPMKN